MWAISTVAKPKDSLSPISLPKNMNRSINEIPVTMSGFIIGILVAVIIADLVHLRLYSKMPTAATEPKIVAIKEESKAKTRVFLRAVIVASLSKSSKYHLNEKPAKREVLLDELKEKTIITARGA